MSERIPLTILSNLVYDEEYARQVMPFIQPEYFEERTDRVVFEQVASFLTEYDALPSKEVLHIEIEKRTDITQDEHTTITQLVSSLATE